LEFAFHHVECRDPDWAFDEVSQFFVDVSSLFKHLDKKAGVEENG